MLHSICQQIWKTQQWPEDWIRSVFIPIPKNGSAKEWQGRLQQYMNQDIPDVQVGFRKGRGTRDLIANIHWIIEETREFQKKHLYLLYWLSQSLWLHGSQLTGKFWKRWGYQTTLPASWETCMQVKKQQLEPDMEQRTHSKLGKEYIKAGYCHPAYLT